MSLLAGRTGKFDLLDSDRHKPKIPNATVWWFLLKEVKDTAKTFAGSETLGGWLGINKQDQDPKTSAGNRLALRKLRSYSANNMPSS